MRCEAYYAQHRDSGQPRMRKPAPEEQDQEGRQGNHVTIGFGTDGGDHRYGGGDQQGRQGKPGARSDNAGQNAQAQQR